MITIRVLSVKENDHPKIFGQVLLGIEPAGGDKTLFALNATQIAECARLNGDDLLKLAGCSIEMGVVNDQITRAGTLEKFQTFKIIDVTPIPVPAVSAPARKKR